MLRASTRDGLFRSLKLLTLCKHEVELWVVMWDFDFGAVPLHAFQTFVKLYNVLQSFICFLFDCCTAQHHKAAAPGLCVHADCPSGRVDFRIKGYPRIKMFAHKSGTTTAMWTQQNAQHLHRILICKFTKALLLLFGWNDFLLVDSTANNCKYIWLYARLCQGSSLVKKATMQRNVTSENAERRWGDTGLLGDWCHVSDFSSAVMWCRCVFLGPWLLLPLCVVSFSE